MRLALKLLLALVAALGVTELAFHLRPELLPRSYRERFPMHGVELFQPGILERTPIEGIPLPIPVGAYAGPPPADLKERGIAPADDDSDARRFPHVEIPVDAQGFPNPAELARADLVLVGDSFAVAAGAREPPGLQAQLAQATGLTVFNLGVAAIGPVQEEWLLDAVGFGKQPRAVLWFLYSGNDVSGVLAPYVHRKRGEDTWAVAYADRRVPRFLLLDLARSLLPSEDAVRERALPGFAFRGADGALQPLWFEPGELLQLEWTREAWLKNIAWTKTCEILRRVRARCAEKGARFLLVYLPTKPETYLPLVAPDAVLAHRTASSILPEPLAEEPETFLAAALAHRSDLEGLVSEFCAAEAIPFLSARPFLEARAREGELGFLVTDTHWQSLGQAALLAPLVELLRAQGIAAP